MVVWLIVAAGVLAVLAMVLGLCWAAGEGDRQLEQARRDLAEDHGRRERLP